MDEGNINLVDWKIALVLVPNGGSTRTDDSSRNFGIFVGAGNFGHHKIQMWKTSEKRKFQRDVIASR